MQIRRRKNRPGWVLDCGVINGHRKQIAFPTKDKALAEKERREDLLRANGQAAFSVSEEERIRFAGARDRLAKAGCTIEEAVEFFLVHHRRIKREIPLKELLEAFLLEKELEGKRKRYLQQLACSCGSFIAGREDASASSVSAEDVKRWVRGHRWQPKTQQVYLGDLRTMFGWALSEKYVSANPCVDLSAAAGESQEVIAMTVRDAERLLRACLSSVDIESRRPFVDLLGFAAIGLFAGVRPEELRLTPRADIDLDQGTVIVAGKRAKTRQRRVVDLSENCVAWLRVWIKEAPAAVSPKASLKAKMNIPRVAMVVPLNFRRRWERLRVACGWKLPWPHDIMRHTFASMHYAAFRNEALLQALMGHESAGVLFSNYRAVRTREGKPIDPTMAAAFWDLRP